MRELSDFWDWYQVPVLMFAGLVILVFAYNYAAIKIGRSRPAAGRWMLALVHALGFAFVPTWILSMFIPAIYTIWLFPLLYPCGVAISLWDQRRKSLNKTA